MPDRCAYCGREEGEGNGYIHLLLCPVCEAVACPVCLALVEFCEDLGNGMVKTWRAAVCKIHIPWNTIEGIKKNAKEKDDEGEESKKITGFDVDIPHEFINSETLSPLEFPELSQMAHSSGAMIVDEITAYNLETKAAVRVRIEGHKN